METNMNKQEKTFKINCPECGKPFYIRRPLADPEAEGTGDESIECMYCCKTIMITVHSNGEHKMTRQTVFARIPGVSDPVRSPSQNAPGGGQPKVPRFSVRRQTRHVSLAAMIEPTRVHFRIRRFVNRLQVRNRHRQVPVVHPPNRKICSAFFVFVYWV